MTNGRIIKKLDLDKNQMTLECFAGEFLFVLSKSNQTNGFEYDLHLSKFSFKFEVNFQISKFKKRPFRISRIMSDRKRYLKNLDDF